MKTIIFDYPYGQVLPARTSKVFRSKADRNKWLHSVLRRQKVERGDHFYTDMRVEAVIKLKAMIDGEVWERWIVGS